MAEPVFPTRRHIGWRLYAVQILTVMALGQTESNVDLCRRQAALVDVVSHHLDDIAAHQAKAYMTCRAVQAARIDFGATDDKCRNGRSEANRRAEHFVRIEASVGMDP